MTGFNDLPNEIVLELWHHVLPPDDIASFALVSKRIFALATPSLREHHRLKSKYAVLKSDGSKDGNMLAHLLKDILLYPYIAFYVKDIRICDWQTCWEDPTLFPFDDVGTHALHVPYPEQDMGLFRDNICKAGNLFPCEEDFWISLLESGHEDPILVLLLGLLPNLCALSLEDIPLRTRLPTAIHRIAETPISTSFSKLRVVELSSSISGQSDHIQPFLLLPSVEKVSCYDLGDYLLVPNVPNYRVASRSSNLTELMFDSCPAMANHLPVLLKGIKELKKFTYVAISETVKSSWIRSCLLNNCQHSLEYLKVEPESEFEISNYACELGSLRLFEKLKTLHIEHSLLLDPVNGAFAVADLLPTFIEAIHLNCHYHLRSEVISLMRLVRSLVNAKRTTLPNLKILKYHFFDFHAADMHLRNQFNGLCQLCGKNGICFTFE